MNNILELNGLSEDLLQTFSYKTLLGISLKKIYITLIEKNF